MNFYETHFYQYLESVKSKNLHKDKLRLYEKIVKKPYNVIFYGPPGIGKYSQSLLLLSNFSQSNLKYEKKIRMGCDKNEYVFKMSDIHIEIDMLTLGCNSKVIWNEFFEMVSNTIYSNNYTRFFILCKNFNNIHNELHDVFYSYMQTSPQKKYKIYFIIITTDVTYINTNILTASYYINLSRPSKASYKKIGIVNINENLNKITSIKGIKSGTTINEDNFISALYSCITSKKLDIYMLRNALYDILILNLDLDKCIWLIMQQFSEMHKDYNMELDLVECISNFYWHYNNNYRPIYHLEKLFISLINEHQRCMRGS